MARIDLTDPEVAKHVDDLRAKNKQFRRALIGMMEIAEQAMPDTYFQSDSRVNAARAALGISKLDAK